MSYCNTYRKQALFIQHTGCVKAGEKWLWANLCPHWTALVYSRTNKLMFSQPSLGIPWELWSRMPRQRSNFILDLQSLLQSTLHTSASLMSYSTLLIWSCTITLSSRRPLSQDDCLELLTWQSRPAATLPPFVFLGIVWQNPACISSLTYLPLPLSWKLLASSTLSSSQFHLLFKIFDRF